MKRNTARVMVVGLFAGSLMALGISGAAANRGEVVGECLPSVPGAPAQNSADPKVSVRWTASTQEAEQWTVTGGVFNGQGATGPGSVDAIEYNLPGNAGSTAQIDVVFHFVKPVPAEPADTYDERLKAWDEKHPNFVSERKAHGEVSTDCLPDVAEPPMPQYQTRYITEIDCGQEQVTKYREDRVRYPVQTQHGWEFGPWSKWELTERDTVKATKTQCPPDSPDKPKKITTVDTPVPSVINSGLESVDAARVADEERSWFVTGMIAVIVAMLAGCLAYSYASRSRK